MKQCLYLLLILFVSGCSSENEKPKQAFSEWFWSQRAYPTGSVNSQVYHQEKNKVLASRNNVLRSPDSWDFEGPTNIGGRVTDIEMIPSSMDLIWVGSASGGAFKSTDQGNTWEAMTENQGAPPVGDICVRPTNPQEVWVGTGESNGGSGSIAYEGFGVIRSMNGGRTWETMGLTQSGSIGRIAMDPSDPSTLYVAAMGYLFSENKQRGIFKTTDGGKTWENILFLNEKTGGSDIIVDPTYPNILYASMWERIKFPDHKEYGGPNSGVYKSIDGGETWEKLDITGNNKTLGRIGIALAPSNHAQLYTLVIDEGGEFEGIFKTYNRGSTWSKINQDLAYNYRTSGYWFCNLTVDPQNAEEIFVCGLDVYHITDSGNRRNTICNIHVDQHSIVLHPANPNLGLIGNDGGVYISKNKFRTCAHFKNLPITQFYTCSLDPTDTEVLYGGTQDNNPVMRKKGTRNWNTMVGGDGFVTIAHPYNSAIIYTEYQYGNIFRSQDRGNSFFRIREGLDLKRSNWNTPFMFNPTNPDVMFFGSHRMHRSDNGGDVWYPISDDLSNGPGGNLTYGTITSIDVSPWTEAVMIAGTDDGNVWITSSGGAKWDLVSQDLPNRWVTRVVCDPENVDRFFVTYSRLKNHEKISHVYPTDQVGENCEDIGAGLPEVPVNDLIVDPENDRRYWAATDLGVFESIDEGETWRSHGEGMPVAIVNDIDFRVSDRMLLAGTYGRSMWSIEVPRLTTSSSADKNDELRLTSDGQQIRIKGKKGNYQLTLYSLDGKMIDASEFSLTENQPWSYSPSTKINGLVVAWVVGENKSINKSRKLFLR